MKLLNFFIFIYFYFFKEGQVTAVDVLLSLGADPSLTDKVGRTGSSCCRRASLLIT